MPPNDIIVEMDTIVRRFGSNVQADISRIVRNGIVDKIDPIAGSRPGVYPGNFLAPD